MSKSVRTAIENEFYGAKLAKDIDLRIEGSTKCRKIWLGQEGSGGPRWRRARKEKKMVPRRVR